MLRFLIIALFRCSFNVVVSVIGGCYGGIGPLGAMGSMGGLPGGHAVMG